jgi:hypothetical protein
VDIPTVSRWLGHKDGGALAMKTYGHLRDEHSTTMAKKVVFVDTSITSGIAANTEKLAGDEPAIGGRPIKTSAQVKAGYSYPWWASKEAIEIFWGQANEPVQIVTQVKYFEAVKEAMGREVFEQELAEPQALLEEFQERVGVTTVEQLRKKISIGQKKQAV